MQVNEHTNKKTNNHKGWYREHSSTEMDDMEREGIRPFPEIQAQSFAAVFFNLSSMVFLSWKNCNQPFPCDTHADWWSDSIFFVVCICSRCSSLLFIKRQKWILQALRLFIRRDDCFSGDLHGIPERASFKACCIWTRQYNCRYGEGALPDRHTDEPVSQHSCL